MIRLLIVDDSAVARKILSRCLGRAGDIEIVGTACNPFVARDKILKLEPDVITLDIEMPRMDGLTFLEKLMKFHPMPAIVVSSMTPRGGEKALRALELGAVDVFCKPGSESSVGEIARSLESKIRAAAAARIAGGGKKGKTPRFRSAEAGRVLQQAGADRILAFGASTGGTEALKAILGDLPASTPGTVIVQHMPESFTRGFAERLNELSPMEVREARGGEKIERGLALVAPGGSHLLVRREAGRYVAVLKAGPRVHFQRPSVEVLFESVAVCAGPKAVGVLLTGMGSDGAKGLLNMRKAGAFTIAQNEESCVVYGMPRVAVELGGASVVLPLEKIPGGIVGAFRSPPAPVGSSSSRSRGDPS